VATKATYGGTASSGVLTVTNAAAATVATLNFTGSYTTASFSLVSDGSAGQCQHRRCACDAVRCRFVGGGRISRQ
jgi:hypothetical protein